MICARSGSRKFPGKNLAEINGKPLIYYSLKAAAESSLLTRAVVSTNSEAVATVARSYNADVPFLRPQEYATEMARIELALIHALAYCEMEEERQYGAVVLLQNSSPLRVGSDIDNCIEVLGWTWDWADSSASVHEFTHPHMLRQLSGKLLTPLRGYEGIYRRQDVAPLYVMNGAVFVVKRDYLMAHGKVIAEKCTPYIMPHWRSMDIDAVDDMRIAEGLMDGSVLPVNT